MSDIQIFISYAREDDLLPPGLSDAKGFVTSLYDDLSFRLEQLGASNIKLWRDTRRLEAGGGIDAGLQAAISHSSMLLVILSPNWLHRESTKNELELFADRWRSIGPERIEQRIVTVGKHFLSVADRPSLLRGQRVFDFFAGHGPEQEFFAAGAVRDERYHRQIDALARHLMRCAAGMSGVQSAPPQEFSPEVCDLFRRLAAAGAAQHPLAKTSASRADLPLVFINAHESDKRQAFELKERLGSRIDSRLPLALCDQGASAARVMADFRENVLECDALVTVWGNAPTTWIRAHQAEVRNLLHQRKKTLRLNIVAPAAALPRDRMRAVGYDQPPEVHDITSAADFVRTELEQLFDATDAPPRSLSAAAVPPVPSGADPQAQIDTVNVSAFAPEAGQAGDEVLVQVFLHCPDDAATASALARQADPGAKPRGVASLETDVARGQKVGISLDAPGLTIAQHIQYLTWRGDPAARQFLVSLPADAAGRQFHIHVRVTLESVLIGELRFTLRGAGADKPVDGDAVMQGDWAKRYRHAFLSYASPDRAEVVKRAMLLKAVGIDFFMDLLTLDPGERWERRLFEEIDHCDIFLLFWSSNAARSDWVVREAEYALERLEGSGEQSPSVTPVIIEGPPVPLPPDSLKRIHFNDPLCYILAGIEATQRGGGRM